MAKNTLLDLVIGYEEPVGAYEADEKKFFLRSVSGSMRTKVRFKGVNKLFLKIGDAFSYASTRNYGVFLLILGLMSLMIEFVKIYFGISQEVNVVTAICGIAMSLIAIPLLFVKMPLCAAATHYALTDYIIFDFFCLPRMHSNVVHRVIPQNAMIIIAIILSLISMFVPLGYIVALLGIIVYITFALTSPEFSFLSTFLIMPYLPFLPNHEMVLSSIVLLTLVSFIRKVIIGKRVYHFEQYDALLYIMLIFVLITGIFVKGVGSFYSSLNMILLAMGYVFTSSLISNRRLADCVINAVIVSGVPVSLYALVQFIISVVNDPTFSFDGMSAAFDDSATLAVFLLVCCLFSMYFASERREKGAKAVYSVFLLIAFIALCTTFEIWAIISATLALMVLGILNLHHGQGFWLTIIGALPYSLIFLPRSLFEFISSIPVLERFNILAYHERWSIGFKMFFDNIFAGIGIGVDSFMEEVSKYEPNFEFSNVANFLLQFAAEAGVFALLVLIDMFFVRIVHRRTYRQFTKNSSVDSIARFSSATVLCLVIYGAFNYIWQDMVMYYLFWCVFGIGSATLRIARREVDDRIAYYSDGRSSNASAIDVNL